LAPWGPALYDLIVVDFVASFRRPFLVTTQRIKSKSVYRTMWTFTECWKEFEFAAWWRHRSLKYVPPLIGVTVPNLVILTAWVYVRIPKTLGPRAALFSWVYGIADPHSTHRTAFSDYTGPDLFCSTVFILNYFSSFLIFWSCGRLSWLIRQLSSARVIIIVYDRQTKFL